MIWIVLLAAAWVVGWWLAYWLGRDMGREQGHDRVLADQDAARRMIDRGRIT